MTRKQIIYGNRSIRKADASEAQEAGAASADM